LREAARRHECPICVLPDLARAYDAAAKRELALATYEEYLTTPWLWRYETDAIELGRIMKRIGELHELRNDRTNAVAAYAKLLRLWENADGEAARERNEVQRRLGTLINS
jgi:hypothetical protein